MSVLSPFLAGVAALKSARDLNEWLPTLDTLEAIFARLAPAFGELVAREEMRESLLKDYYRLTPVGPQEFKPRALLANLSQRRQKLIAYVACQEREAQLVREIGRGLEPFIEIAHDIYRGPLREVMLHLVPVIPQFLSQEQLQRLVQRCPHVPWPSPNHQKKTNEH